MKSAVFLVLVATLAACHIRETGSDGTEARESSSAVREATTTAPPPITPIPIEAQRPRPPVPGAPMELLALIPQTTVAGMPFNPQKNGESALAVTTANVFPGTKLVFDGHELATTFGSPELLTAIVPAELLVHPRTVSVSLEKGDATSNALTFTITRE